MKRVINLSVVILSAFIISAQAETLPNIEYGEPVAKHNDMHKAKYIEARHESTDEAMQILQRLDTLQQTVQDLHGLIEVQQHEIDSLHAKQRDLYLDLDRRLGAAKQHSSKRGKLSATKEETLTSPKVLYKQAYQHLKQKEFTQAKSEFNTIVQDHNSSPLAANANYWLGEIYLLEGEDKLAWGAFENVVKQFPHHNKASDALFKLGLISMDNGKLVDAQGFFSRLKQQFPNSSSAKLAEKHLRKISTYISNDQG